MISLNLSPENFLSIIIYIKNDSIILYLLQILAEIVQDLLANKDDYLRALRILLREIVKNTRLDMNFYAFCLQIMQERLGSLHTNMDTALKVNRKTLF